MFADPQSVTIATVAKSLPLVKQTENQRTYTNDTGEFQLVTKQNVTNNRFRREARIVQTIVAADPLSAENDYQSASVYLVIDEPKVGFTDTQLQALVTGLKDWLSSANQLKILGGEL